MKACIGGLAVRSIATGIAIVFGLGNTAVAQQVVLEEIIVTARKVEEDILDVPIAVTPFSAEAIRQLGLRNTEDLSLFTPGFSFTPAFGRQGGSDRPSMRGISTIVNGVANATSVAYFVDGVYMGGSPQATELANIERVEILRGPQAAQFGRGTYVGAINYVTRRPGDEVDAEMELTAGQDGLFVASGWASGPITDTLGAFAAVSYDTFDGQYTNNRDNSDVGGEQATSVTGKLYWTPNERFDATLKLSYLETDDDHFAVYLQGREFNNVAFRNANSPRSREYYLGEAIPNKNEVNLLTDALLRADRGALQGVKLERSIFSLTLNWEVVEDLTLTSVTGYIDDTEQTGFDASYAGYSPFFAPSAFLQIDKDEQSDLSQELRLLWTGLEGLTISLGGYYYEGERNEIYSYGVNPTTGVTNFLVSNNSLEKIENLAVFGAVSWDVTERISVGLEARYAEDEVTRKEVAQSDGSLDTLNNGTFESFTPRFTGVWRLYEGLNMYGNIAKGTKPGDFNDSSQCPQLPVNVDEEKAWNYEIGLKGSVFDNRAQFGIAGYFLDVEDQQLTTVCEIPGSGGLTTVGTTNVGKTEVYGLEFESAFLLTDNWSAGLTYAYTDAEITENINVDQADLLGSLGGTAQTIALGSVAGNRVPRISDHQFSLNTRYENQLSGGFTWFIGADVAYESSKFSQVHNYIETGDRTLVGARVGFSAGPWEVTFWGKNILRDDTPVDVLRYIDVRGGFSAFLQDCADFSPPADCVTPTADSRLPRGFALTLPRQQQFGITLNYRLGRNQ